MRADVNRSRQIFRGHMARVAGLLKSRVCHEGDQWVYGRGLTTMTIFLRAEDEPEKTRREYWRYVFSDALVPYDIRDTGDSFRSYIHIGDVGPVRVINFAAPAAQAVRNTRMIRDSDRDMCKIDLAVRGSGAVYEQDGRQSRLQPGDFHLVDLSRPSRVLSNQPHDLAIVTFPRALLPMSPDRTRDLTAVPFSASDACAGLVSSLVRQVAQHLADYERARDARIGTAVLDLLTVAVASRLDRMNAVPPETRERTTLVRVHAFIERNLSDPDLSPPLIAAAHHISVRTLHNLFQAEGRTVGTWIRRRRLDRIRKDLLDPALAHKSVAAIGARWGIPDGPTFSRMFREAHGVPPGEFRSIEFRTAESRAAERARSNPDSEPHRAGC